MAARIRPLLPTLLLVIFLAACSKPVAPLNDVPQSVPVNCVSQYVINQQQSPLYVVRTQAEYAALQSTLRDTAERCSDSTFPSIDFSRYTLLGKQTMGSGCLLTVPVDRMSIVRDPVAETVVWKIVHVEHGACKPLRYATSWVIVPLIPADYSVTVTVTTERVE